VGVVGRNRLLLGLMVAVEVGMIVGVIGPFGLLLTGRSIGLWILLFITIVTTMMRVHPIYLRVGIRPVMLCMATLPFTIRRRRALRL